MFLCALVSLMHQNVRLDLTSHTEDWFHVMVDKVDVASAFKKHEELATAELRTTSAHTNSIVRELRVTTAHVETIAREGENLPHVFLRELITFSSAQGTGSVR